MNRQLKLVLVCLSIIIVWPLTTYSQSVSAVKGKKVLINAGDMILENGDRVFTLNNAGKKVSLLEVLQVRGGKAVAQVLKGTPSSGQTVTIAKRSSKSSSSTGDVISGLRSGSAYGFTGSLMMNTMKISDYSPTPSTSYSFEMTGTNFGVGGFYDYPLSHEWFARGHGTFEMFDVKKSQSAAICDGGTTTNCNANFMQLGMYGTFNYIFSPSPRRFWAGGGGGLVVYASKESTVLDTNKFFFNTVLMLAGGVDFFMSRTTFIPVAFEYQMIPDKEAGVTSMVLRAGWGKTF